MSVPPDRLAQEFAARFGAPGVASAGSSGTPGPEAPAETPACRPMEFARCGVHLEARVDAAQVVEVARWLNDHGYALDTLTGVDWLARGEMEVVYDYFHPRDGWRVAVRTRVPRAAPEVPTIREVYPGADWHERETHEFFGIRFAGHPNLTPLLLPEDADYHPLRKDYAPETPP